MSGASATFRCVEPASRRGRPRSEDARQAIVAAALDLLTRTGYGAVTIEGVAAAAGVGKQTIYRWWSSRSALMLEVLREVARLNIRDRDRGSLEGDLEGFLSDTFALARRIPAIPALLRGLMAEAQLDPTFLATLRRELIEPRRAALAAVLARAEARGELRAGQDKDLLLDLAFGFLWYRLLVGHAPLAPRAARALAHALCLAAGSSQARRRPDR
jgi:AcrR family transcriptional regulator